MPSAPHLRMTTHMLRAAGADASIYPNADGRFGLSRRRCEAINGHLRGPLGELHPAFPVPAGGMDVARAPGWVRRYGIDTILLIGGSLYARGDLVRGARELLEYMADSKPFPKPVIACFTAPPGIWEEEIQGMDGNKGRVILPTPERAAKATGNLWKVNQLRNGKGR